MLLGLVGSDWVIPVFLLILCRFPLTHRSLGKSVLTSFIVEQVRLLSPAPTLLFFYCKSRDNSRDDFISIARSFLSELLRCHHDVLAPFIYDKFSKSSEAVLSKVQDIEELLRVSLLNCAKVYIVIDGIDECGRDQRKRITSWFRDIVENLEPPRLDRIRCLFVSQDDGVARKDFDGITTLKIKSADVENDIEQYSLYEAAQIQSVFQLSDDIRANIASTIKKAADGTYIDKTTSTCISEALRKTHRNDSHCATNGI